MVIGRSRVVTVVAVAMHVIVIRVGASVSMETVALVTLHFLVDGLAGVRSYRPPRVPSYWATCNMTTPRC